MYPISIKPELYSIIAGQDTCPGIMYGSKQQATQFSRDRQDRLEGHQAQLTLDVQCNKQKAGHWEAQTVCTCTCTDRGTGTNHARRLIHMVRHGTKSWLVFKSPSAIIRAYVQKQMLRPEVKHEAGQKGYLKRWACD